MYPIKLPDTFKHKGWIILNTIQSECVMLMPLTVIVTYFLSNSLQFVHI